MGWMDRLRQMTRPLPIEKPADAGTGPQTYVKASASKNPLDRFLNKSKRNRKDLARLRNIYEKGGIVTQAVDAIPLYILMNGYKLDSKDEAKKKEVQQFLDDICFHDIAEAGITDAMVVRDGIQEIEFTKGGQVYDVHPRAAEMFEIVADEKGTILSYDQYRGTGTIEKRVATLEPKEVVHLKLLYNADGIYGDSMIERAEHDINRDVITMDSSTTAIQRHGTPKRQTKVGSDENPATDPQLRDVEKEMQDPNARTDYVTRHDVEIKNIDEMGVVGLDTYHRVSVQRLCAALGVPGEVLGIREGTTDNTAVTRINTFFKRINAFQLKVASAYNTQLIDRYTGVTGLVKIVFNPCNQPTEDEMVTMMDKVIKWDPLNPMPYIKFAFKRLNWPWEEVEKDIEEQDVEVVAKEEAQAAANPLLDPAVVAAQEKMKATAGKDADMVDDGK